MSYDDICRECEYKAAMMQNFALIVLSLSLLI
jgi:hypothetical protein